MVWFDPGMFETPMPRSRDEIASDWMRALESSHDPNAVRKFDRCTDGLLLEVLCDIRDLTAECAIRLSDLEAELRARRIKR
jgi:hypothetical protein